MFAPIIVFVYNRLQHTKKTIDALRKNEFAEESELYIFSDGPKMDATVEQKAKVYEVQDYIRSITGFKKIFIKTQKTNKGLANSVISGVTEIIKKYGKAIVVEDDIITHPYFLRYMNDCLDIYKERKDIYMIGGFNHNINFPWWYKKDIYLTYRSCSWGWATWKDRWDNADWEVSGYDEMLRDEKLQKLFNRGGDDNFRMLKMQMEGKMDSWCIRWDYCMFKHNAFCVLPRYSLVNNCGFDGTGVHCVGTRANYTAPFPVASSYYFKLPPQHKYSPSVEDRLMKFLRFEPAGSEIYKHKIRRLFHMIGITKTKR